MEKNLVAALLLLFTSVAGAAPADVKAGPASAAKKPAAPKAFPLPQLLREVEAKYAIAKTLRAKFNQVVESSLSKQKQSSDGVLMFKRPNQIRWETESPDKSLFVSDGVTAWFYTPPFDSGDKDERGEYHERKASSVQTKLANALLSGSFSVARDMTIRAESALVFTMAPKKRSSDPIQKATIEVDPKDRVIRKVTIEHRGGNKTVITLSEIELGKNIESSLFTFTPPPNTDRADED